ncbi:Zn-ribbon domain-containing OB-fold protein [Nocardioides montaniterrae]
MTATPVVDGWFTTSDDPRLLAARCTDCGDLVFPPPPSDASAYCRNPRCAGTSSEPVELSRRGRIWSYTDAQYQPPAPYVAQSDPFVPFALAAVELPEGLVVLGQVATGFGVADLKVGAEVELVVEPLDAESTIWRWRPTA